MTHRPQDDSSLLVAAATLNTHALYGPLAWLIGIWEGDKGDDRAPDDDRQGIEHNRYRERMKFEPIGMVNNHEQTLYGLRYKTKAFRIGEPDSFHEEVGYWLWDSAEKQVMRCFIVPRGVMVNAGGTVEPDAKTFTLAADLGSPTYGICSNQFLDREFKTVRYELKIEIHNERSFSYEEHTHLKMKHRPDLFDHSDKNKMTRTSD